MGLLRHLLRFFCVPFYKRTDKSMQTTERNCDCRNGSVPQVPLPDVKEDDKIQESNENVACGTDDSFENAEEITPLLVQKPKRITLRIIIQSEDNKKNMEAEEKEFHTIESGCEVSASKSLDEKDVNDNLKAHLLDCTVEENDDKLSMLNAPTIESDRKEVVRQQVENKEEIIGYTVMDKLSGSAGKLRKISFKRVKNNLCSEQKVPSSLSAKTSSHKKKVTFEISNTNGHLTDNKLNKAPSKANSKCQTSFKNTASSKTYDPELIKRYNDRMNELEQLWITYNNIVEQASKAVEICENSKERRGSQQHIESERLLLVATLRKDATMAFIGNATSDNILNHEQHNFGTVFVKNLFFPGTDNKQPNNYTTWYIALISSGRDVYATKATTADEDGHVMFDEEMKIDRLSTNFKITVSLYGTTMLKTVKNKNWIKFLRTATPSPFLPPRRERQKSSFQPYGKTIISINDLKKTDFSMSEVPRHSKMLGYLNTSFRVALTSHPTQANDALPKYW